MHDVCYLSRMFKLRLKSAYFWATAFASVAIGFSNVSLGANAVQSRKIGTEQAFEKIVEENRARVQPEWFVQGVVPEGPHKGDAILTDTTRSITILNGTSLEKTYPLDPGDVLVGNIYHEGQFWVGRIRAGSVERMTFALSKFLGYTGHGMDRFVFAKPVELLALIHSDGNAVELETLDKPVLLNDLFASYEVAFSEHGPQGYDPKLGLHKEYASVYRLLSAKERAFNYYYSGTLQDQWWLNYNKKESNLALLETFVTAHTLGYSQMYNTITSNCIRCAMEIQERANGHLARAKNPLSKSLQAVAALSSKIRPPEVFTGTALLMRGQRNWNLSGEKSYLETDPTLKPIYDEVRQQRINDLATEDTDQAQITKLEKKFGDVFVDDIRVARSKLRATERLASCRAAF